MRKKKTRISFQRRGLMGSRGWWHVLKVGLTKAGHSLSRYHKVYFPHSLKWHLLISPHTRDSCQTEWYWMSSQAGGCLGSNRGINPAWWVFQANKANVLDFQFRCMWLYQFYLNWTLRTLGEATLPTFQVLETIAPKKQIHQHSSTLLVEEDQPGSGSDKC